MTLLWKEPPATMGRKAAVDRPSIVRQLRASPGTWAMVQEKVSPSGAGPWKKLGCEAVARRNAEDPKKADIYARWPKDTPPGDARHAPARPPAAESSTTPTPSATAAASRQRPHPAKATLPLTTKPADDPTTAQNAQALAGYLGARRARLNGVKP